MDSDQEADVEGGTPGPAADSRSRITRLAQIQVFGAAGFLGLLTAIVGLMIWTAANQRGQLPQLTVEQFEQAKQRWQAHAPADYDVTIEVAGRQAAVYHVEVRAGEVVVSTRNSRPLKQRRTRGTWSVPGMFSTMQADVDNAEQHRLGTAKEGVPQVQLHAMFDPEYGFPRRYHRTELRKFGNNEPVFWEVTQFDVIPREDVAADSGKSDHGTVR